MYPNIIYSILPFRITFKISKTKYCVYMLVVYSCKNYTKQKQ